jgi:hypothetical protein
MSCKELLPVLMSVVLMIVLPACESDTDNPLVPVEVESITLDKNSFTLAPGDSVQLIATITPAEATDQKITWTSGNLCIAHVDSNGWVKAMAKGDVTITASARHGSRIAIATVVIRCVSASAQMIKPVSSYKLQYNGHAYIIVNRPSTWMEAAQIAADSSGYLAAIDSETEAHQIERAIVKSGFAFTCAAPDGGGARYLWIGATDSHQEGSWYWSSTLSPGVSTTRGPCEYTNWGINSYGQRIEPDNYPSPGPDGLVDQDYAAIALDNWPNGKQYQWNDLNGFNKLAFIIEVERQ